MKWDDLNSYSYTDGHTTKDWGWEFIRRNEQYRQEWKIALSEFHKIYAEKPDCQKALFEKEWERMIGAPHLSEYTGDKSLNDMAYNFYDEAQIDTFIIISEKAKKWGLKGYQNPQSNKLNKALISSVKMLYVSGEFLELIDVKDNITVAPKENSLVAVLDITKPVETQIEEIKTYAIQQQNELKEKDAGLIQTKTEKISQNDKILWINYLRCLDAEEAKVDRKISARHLFPGAEQGSRTKFRDALKQIKKMASKNFSRFMS